MEHFFHTIRITNFKSLKDVTLSDCRRINVLIGKPNVGKSNILEAIGLFSLPYMKYNESKKMTQFVRLEDLPELFFDGNILNEININTDDGSHCVIRFVERTNSIDCKIFLNNQSDSNFPSVKPELFRDAGDDFALTINNQLCLDYLQWITLENGPGFPPKVKFYRFSSDLIAKKPDAFIRYLLPPSGTNSFDVLQAQKELRTDLAQIFSEYRLKLLFDKAKYALRLMKLLEEDNIISFPYTSIADTLQRLIFFKAAIASNQNSILLFEEPEAHCFPPYVTHITQEIIDSETNQFFVATHSSYVLTTCLERESSRKDVAIFMVDFKNGQTVINRLTDDERDEVYEYGLDLFFNSELFTDD